MTMTLEQLDPAVGQWIREEATRHARLVVTDAGRPIITLIPAPKPVDHGSSDSEPNYWANREFPPGVEALINTPCGGTDSTDIISQDREDRL